MVLGSALARSPSRASCASQASRVAAIRDAVSHAELISKSCEGKCPMPQSLLVSGFARKARVIRADYVHVAHGRGGDRAPAPTAGTIRRRHLGDAEPAAGYRGPSHLHEPDAVPGGVAEERDAGAVG